MKILVSIIYLLYYIRIGFSFISCKNYKKICLKTIGNTNYLSKKLFQNNKKQKSEDELRRKADRYLAMKRLKEIKARSDNSSYSSSSSSSSSKSSSKNKAGGYSKFVGRKGNLDARLRNIVAYKRNYLADPLDTRKITDQSIDNISEESELESLMEDTEGDENYIDDEEAMYEILVQEVLEKNKLAAVKRNFMTDTDKGRNITSSFIDNNDNNNKNLTSLTKEEEDADLYVPARSSWGVFKRPKDISKAYGGGKVITKEQMRKQDEEFEEAQRAKLTAQKTERTASMRIQNENEERIRTALTSARGYIRYGNCKRAVKELEEIKDKLSVQTELGGETYLELGMAYETVNQADDARKIYGLLASKSRSPKIRQYSMQLLQGLDITSQLRKDINTNTKPILDPKNMYIMSNNLRAGLTDKWADYKKKDMPVDNNILSQIKAKEIRDLANVSNFTDAIYILHQCLNPLQIEKIPTSSIGKSLRMIYITKDDEKLEYLKQTMSRIYVAAVREASTPSSSSYSNSAMLLKSISASSKPATSKSNSALLSSSSDDVRPGSTPISSAFKNTVNGTWDLVLSWSDVKNNVNNNWQNNLQFFDYPDDIRRDIDLQKMKGIEKSRTFFGLSELSMNGQITWDSSRSELSFMLDNNRKSSVPVQPRLQRRQDENTVQIIWADGEIKITRQPHDNINYPDLYCLWKKVNTKMNRLDDSLKFY